MPILTNEILDNVLSVLENLKRQAEKSDKVFQQNLTAIIDLKQYIEDNRGILANEDPLVGYDCRKEIIDSLAAIKTNKSGRKATIEDLIDQFTSDDPYSSIYAGLKKLEFKEAFSDFITGKTGKQGKARIDAITAYIKYPTNRPTFGSVQDRRQMKQMFIALAIESKDKEKLDLINSLKSKLDGCFMDNQEIIDINKNLPNEVNLVESKSDWDRTSGGNNSIGEINNNKIKSSKDIIQYFEGFGMTDDVIANILKQLKAVEFCGAYRFAEAHSISVSQAQRINDGKYNFTTLSDGNIQIDFRCSGTAAKLGTKDVRHGELAIRGIFDPNTYTLTVNRRFDEKIESQPTLTPRRGLK